MKKGLLSLLAVALTVVGCQNYDDQFQSLTDQITALSTALDEDVTAVRNDIQSLRSLVAALATTEQLNNSVASLSSQITSSVSSLTSDISDVSDDVSDLSDDVSDLSDDVADVTDDVSDLSDDVSDVSDDVADVQTTVSSNSIDLDAIADTLDDILNDLALVSTSAELLAVSTTLGLVQDDVEELLQAGSVIDQNLVITNGAQLEYAEELISTEDGDPLVIINGYVKIDTGFTPAITAAQLASVNEITAQIKTILGEGTAGTRGLEIDSDTSLNFGSLVFVDDNYDINGPQATDSLLRTISGSLLVSQTGNIDYSQLASVGGDVTLNAGAAANATAIDFENVIIEGSLSHGTGSTLTFPEALSVKLGTASFETLNANKANTIEIALSSTASDLIINATNGGTININAIDALPANFGVTGSTTTTLNVNDLASITGTSTIVAGTINMGSLATFGDADYTAETSVVLSSVGTVTNDLDLNDSPAATLTALVKVDGTLTWDIATINLPNAVIAGDIASAVGTNVTVASVGAISTEVPTAEHLTLTAQAGNIAEGSAYTTVTNLTITAKSGSAITYTDANLGGVTTLDTTDVTTLTLSNAALDSFDAEDGLYIDIAAASGLATATTSGDIIRFISAASTLAEWNNTANVKDDPAVLSGEEAVTIDISNSTLESIDLSSMHKVRVVDLDSSNGSLVEVVAPSSSDPALLLTPGANPSFNIFLSTTVTYTAAQYAIQDGVNPDIPFVEACLHAPGVASWPAYVTAVLAANPTATTTIDFTSVQEVTAAGVASETHADIATAFADDEASLDSSALGRPSGTTAHVGILGAQTELAILSSTACN